jgi:hypothetical protein
MFFASHAIVSYIAFSIYQYQGGELTMPRISYVLAMLHLPKLSLANFFVRGEARRKTRLPSGLLKLYVK